MDNVNNNNPEMNTENSIAEQEQKIRAGHKSLRKKSAMLMVGGIVLVVVLFALGIAWYTRISNTYSVKFDVAEYDLAINNNVDDYFVINVYDYNQVTNNYMAPGTIGWLPLDISAEYSKVDESFAVSIRNAMPDELKNHFRFFVLQERTLISPAVAADPDNGINAQAAVYSDWTYVFDDAYQSVAAINTGITNGTLRKVYLDPKVEDSTDADNQESPEVTGTVTKGSSKTLCIYWQWYLDLDEAVADGIGSTEKTIYYAANAKAKYASLTADQITAAKTLWDQVDTDIGRYPDKYEDALTIFVYASGAQINPADGTKSSADETTSQQTSGDNTSGEENTGSNDPTE